MSMTAGSSFSSITTQQRMDSSSGRFAMAEEDSSNSSNNDKPKKRWQDMTGFERFQAAMKEYEETKDDPKKRKGPPIYPPGPYQNSVLASLAYVIPIVDASDLSKYMFQAYPALGDAYSTVYGPLAAIYNGVPFLPFALFFLMSYVCRAPNFPTEVRFHFSQAFMIGLFQFVPSLLFGFLEKAGVPGMAIAYNTVFLWTMVACLSMQFTLLNPLSASKNPLVVNVFGLALRYMNWTPELAKGK